MNRQQFHRCLEDLSWQCRTRQGNRTASGKKLPSTVSAREKRHYDFRAFLVDFQRSPLPFI